MVSLFSLWVTVLREGGKPAKHSHQNQVKRVWDRMGLFLFLTLVPQIPWRAFNAAGSPLESDPVRWRCLCVGRCRGCIWDLCL